DVDYSVDVVLGSPPSPHLRRVVTAAKSGNLPSLERSGSPLSNRCHPIQLRRFRRHVIPIVPAIAESQNRAGLLRIRDYMMRGLGSDDPGRLPVGFWLRTIEQPWELPRRGHSWYHRSGKYSGGMTAMLRSWYVLALRGSRLLGAAQTSQHPECQVQIVALGARPRAAGQTAGSDAACWGSIRVL